MLDLSDPVAAKSYFDSFDQAFLRRIGELDTDSHLSQSLEDLVEQLAPDSPMQQMNRRLGCSNFSSVLFKHCITMGAETLGDGLELLKNRKIDVGLIEKWLPHGVFTQPRIYFALQIGYPEYSEKNYEVRRSDHERVFSQPAGQFARFMGGILDEELGQEARSLSSEQQSLIDLANESFSEG